MLRAISVGVGLSAAALAALGLLVPTALAPALGSEPWSAAPFEDLLLQLVSIGGTAGVLRIWLVGGLAVLDALRASAPVAAAARPGGVVRRWVLLACGAAVTGTLLAGPAQADDVRPGAGGLAGLPFPDRATDAAEAAATTAPPVAGPAARPVTTRVTEVVVQPGDSLWSIAQRALPPAAGPAQVQTYWHQVWQHNRDLVGPVPDLIHPGQRLLLPEPDREDRP